MNVTDGYPIQRDQGALSPKTTDPTKQKVREISIESFAQLQALKHWAERGRAEELCESNRKCRSPHTLLLSDPADLTKDEKEYLLLLAKAGH